MPRAELTSFQNPRIKLARKLQDKRQREREGLFVIDYARDLERALQNNYQVDFVLVCSELLSSDEAEIINGLQSTADIFDVSADLLTRASYRQNPSGIVAVVKAKPQPNIQDIPEDHQQILCLVNLRKPGNIGALLRTADATGFRSTLLIDTALDIYNPNIIRSSTGAVFLDNLYAAQTPMAVDFLKSQGYQIVSGYLGGQRDLFDVDFTRPTAVVLGTEDTGLSEEWLGYCDELVEIPMTGHVTDSLNVSVAGAVFMYEALRQNRSHKTNL